MKPAPPVPRILSLVGLTVLVGWVAGCQPPGGGTRFEAVVPTQGDLRQHVTASGTLSAVVSVEVGSQVSGKVTKLHVDFNSPVKRGQLVAEIDPTLYAAALHQAEGELASAVASLTLKRQNLVRKQTLVPLKAASQFDLDQATAEVAQTEATVAIREAVLTSARANLGFCQITAPVDGLVISRRVDLGQTVISAMATPVLFTIAGDLSQMNLSASISEADVGQVREGQAVEFTVDAYPEETFQGQVKQVRRSPTTTQGVVTYETLIAVENRDQRLFPGMTAEVSIRVAERRGILKVPNTALRFSPPEGVRFEEAPPQSYGRNQRLVYVQGRDPATLRPVLVRAGITDGVETEILEGLALTNRVVTSTLAFQVPGTGFLPKGPPEVPQ
jgi:HlyD family secretion protein